MVFELDKMPYQTVQGPDPYKKLMAIKQKKQQVCQEQPQPDYPTQTTTKLLEETETLNGKKLGNLYQ